MKMFMQMAHSRGASFHPDLTASKIARRDFLRWAVGSAAFFTTSGLFAEMLTLTPRQTEGPFYPDKLPLDTDNDLIIVNNSLAPAVGEITWLNGRVLDRSGAPIRNAVIEIWQCDARGVYINSHSVDHREQQDKNFQGYGRFLTGSTGAYVFRTIKPVAYPGRTPHIHFKISQKGKELLTTQCYIKGETRNTRDGIWKSIRDPKARDSVTVDFKPMPTSRAGELAAEFNIVLGVTPEG